MELLPRERVELALDHKDTDRVPTDFWAVPEIWERLLDYYHTTSKETILENLKIDVRTVVPDYIGPKMPTFADGSYYKTNGTHRRMVKNEFGAYEEHASFPLAKAEMKEEIDSFRWPKLEWYDFDHLSEKIENLHEKYYIKIETGGIFELAWGLRGLEQFMIDMAMGEDIPHWIMGHLTDFYCGYIENVMEKAGDKIDVVYTYDDIAGQNGLLVSPRMWETYIKPYHERLNSVIKRYGKKILYHSCGAVVPMIDRLMELPIDILNPLQPKADGMDMRMIKDRFGDRICFHGAIDIQELLPKGTVQQVADTARKTIDILSKNGGYILASAHFIQADTPIENILALYESVINK